MARCLLVWCCVFGAVAAQANVTASRRHVVMLGAGTDEVFGQYLFTVQNATESPTQAELAIMLAKEKKDWFPQEGVLPKDVKLGEGGAAQIIVSQEWKPGDTFVVFNFTAPASLGNAELTFEVPYEMEDLLVMTPVARGSLKISSADMEFRASQNFAGKVYDMLQVANLKAGQTLTVKLQGVAEGRARFWWIGGFFAFFLTLAAGVFAWRQRPKESPDDAVVEGTFD